MPRLETGTESPPDTSLARIIRDLRDDALALLRQEVALAKREMALKFARLGRNAVFLAAGALIGFFCVFFFLLSLSDLLQAGLYATGFSGTVAGWLAPLLLAMLLGVAALTLALKALRTLRKLRPVPEGAAASLRENREWLKGKMP